MLERSLWFSSITTPPSSNLAQADQCRRYFHAVSPLRIWPKDARSLNAPGSFEPKPYVLVASVTVVSLPTQLSQFDSGFKHGATVGLGMGEALQCTCARQKPLQRPCNSLHM